MTEEAQGTATEQGKVRDEFENAQLHEVDAFILAVGRTCYLRLSHAGGAVWTVLDRTNNCTIACNNELANRLEKAFSVKLQALIRAETAGLVDMLLAGRKGEVPK